VKRSPGTILLAIVCFALGAAVQRYYDARTDAAFFARQPPQTAPPGVDFAAEPLWAYGFTAVRKAGETAAPQSPPTRDLRPNEDANEQRGRGLSTAARPPIHSSTFATGRTSSTGSRAIIRCRCPASSSVGRPAWAR